MVPPSKAASSAASRRRPSVHALSNAYREASCSAPDIPPSWPADRPTPSSVPLPLQAPPVRFRGQAGAQQRHSTRSAPDDTAHGQPVAPSPHSTWDAPPRLDHRPAPRITGLARPSRVVTAHAQGDRRPTPGVTCSGCEGSRPSWCSVLRAAGVGQGGAPAAKRGRTTLTNPRAGACWLWAEA